MFTDNEWKIIYSNVFKVFPCPNEMIKQIIIKDKKKKIKFNSSAEFFKYLCEHEEKMNVDAEYILKDNTYKDFVNKIILKYEEQIKKRD